MTTTLEWGLPRICRQVRAETLREGDWLLIVPYVGGSPVFKRIDVIERHAHPERPWLRVSLERVVNERDDRAAGSRVWEVAGPHHLHFQSQEPAMIGVTP